MIVFVYYGGEGDAVRLTGNPTVTNAEGIKIRFQSLLSSGATVEEKESFGVYSVEILPPEGQQWTGAFNGMIPVYEDIPPPDPEPIPRSVSMRKARLALHGAGLLATIEAAIDALDEPDRTAVRIEWEYAQDVSRDHPWVQALLVQLGLTEQQVDDLFAAAAAIPD